MSVNSTFIREAKFAFRDRSLMIWVLIVMGLSTLSVGFGLSEVKQQRSSIQSLIEADQQDRLVVSAKLKSWGSAAYYSFHLTYDPPSKFAFAALGQRDLQPWKHRIRMLALEGQIYERDAGNPVIALIGRFDFAFLAAFILPLVLIMLLYDLRSGERTAGRHDLLEATAGRAQALWCVRAGVKVGAVFFSLIIPLLIAGLVAGSTLSTLIWASVFVFLYTVFWAFLCYFLAAWRKPDSLILMSLVGIWLSLAVILPAGARLAIDRIVPIPSGADILMLQRETVNDAWDLPRKVTMDAFFERHPEWSDYSPVASSFEWPWYYAFQQVGDQEAEQLSVAYRDGRKKRDHIAAWMAVFLPPSLMERALQALAKTNQASALAYEEKVRTFHAELRAFYYPKFFQNTSFDKSELERLPRFDSDH